MARLCKLCSPFVPGLTGLARPPRSAPEELAVRERVDNTRVTVLRGPRLGGLGGLGGAQRTRAAFEVLKLWENGRTLRCRFLDGLPEVQAKVEAIAKEWEQHANLKLEFVTSGTAQIRISFAEKDFSWSTVGTDALGEPAAAPTMNYGWLEPATAIREYQRVVRHEFGHALGMIHEHQNPAAQGLIPWDKPKVLAHYAQQGWTAQDVEHNIFSVYAEDATNHSAFDRDSIMLYAVPDALTVGSFAIGWNTAISAVDAAYMARQYPRGAPAETVLTVGAAATQASLATGGEVDTYRFEVTAAATHIMTTQGPSDTVLTLHGPGDPGAVLAFDDDRGQGLNARIVRKLQAGTYWLTVRHKQPGGTGSYTVGVKRRA